MSNLSWLYQRFAEHKERTFIVWREREYNYGFLLDETRRWGQLFDQANLGAGQIVSLEGDYSPATVSALLSLIERDAIIVPLTDSVAVHKNEFREIAGVQLSVVISDDGSHALTAHGATAGNELIKKLIDKQHPGLIVFSSGSTGKHKAALHDFLPLLEKHKQPRHSFVTLTFLLLDHLGGINTLFYTLSNTGTIVAVDNRNPTVVLQAVAKYKVELLPTSPTFLNLVLISEAYNNLDLSSLKRITYGTEVMPSRTLERLCEIFPHVDFQQTYGLSELGVLRSKSKARDSLWMKIGGEGFDTKIVEGILHIRAQSTMLGYLNAQSPIDKEGWFNTGDAVEVEGEWLKILGRTSEIINVGGLKVFPAEVENVLMGMANVSDAVVRGEQHPITGQIVVAHLSLVQPEPAAAVRTRLREYCKSRLAGHKIPSKVEVVEGDQFSQRFKKMTNTSKLQF